jgi:pimeloyl-ACP methyl ester carboxylesterase
MTRTMNPDPLIAEDQRSGASARGGQTSRRWYRTLRLVLLMAIVLIVGGGIIANTSQTAGGKIRIVRVNYPTETGLTESGLLYIPPNATATTPACGVVTIEGYINTYDTMDGFSIEMARRGCVVLDADQTGQGTSEGPSFADEFGGPPSLAYLNSLPIVKKGDVGLIGHSMGGWASVLAAAVSPKGRYRSVVLISSSVSTPGVEPVPGTPAFPRNIEVVEAKYSEFSRLMWDVPKGSEIPQSSRLEKMFGTTSTVQTGKVYGSIAAGTGRQLYLQDQTHPGMTFDPGAVQHAIAWEQATLTGVGTLSPTNQIWIWDEIGCFLALIGVALFLFGAAGELLRIPYFAAIQRGRPENRSISGSRWWPSAALLAILGPVTFFVFQLWGEHRWPGGSFFPESITSGIVAWAVGDILIGLVLFLVWHFTTKREVRGNLHTYGLTEPTGRLDGALIGRSVLFGIATVVLTYIPVYLFEWAFSSDVRLWVFNIQPLDYAHAKIALDYLGPFLIYFIGLSIILFGQLRTRMRSLGTFMLATTGLLVVGFAVFIALEYGVLLTTGELMTSSQPLLSIVSLQFIPVYILIGTILSYFFWKTGRLYSGIVIGSLLITAIVVANTATQGVVW